MIDPDRRVPMRHLTPAQAIKTFAEVPLGYSREEAIVEARRAGDADLSAATAACPFGVDAAGLAQRIAAGDFAGAQALVHRAHAWPGVLGRWCHKFCEDAHTLPDGTPLSIGHLERAAADHGGPLPPFVPGAPTGKRVAIIGAGSAAAAAAWRLRAFGHAVTLYEALPVAGGMTAVGYPEFRLPAAVAAREHDLARWGCACHFGVTVDRALVHRLLAEHDAVIAGTGKFAPLPLDIPGEALEGVWDALDFLVRVKLGRPAPIGKKVVVLGAGYSAQDSSRAARRFGAEVVIYYRRRPEDMPVNQQRLAFYRKRQEDEGAPYVFEVMPRRILAENGRVAGVTLCRTMPGPPDASGRREAVPVPGSDFTVACDTVIAAIGQRPDLSYLPEAICVTADGHVAVDKAFATSIPRLYAVGEMMGSRGTTGAYRSGLDCAAALDRRLRQQEHG